MYEGDQTLAQTPETSAASKRDLQSKFQVAHSCSGMAIEGARQAKSQVAFIRGSAKREILPL